jgi:hypothetical protein
MPANAGRFRIPPLWVGVVAVALVLLLAWLVIEFTGPRGQNAAVTEHGPDTGAGLQPGAVPTQPGLERVADLDAILPLGAEDVGIRTEVQGTVVGEPTPEGFFVRLESDEVLFVASDEPVRTGDHVRGLTGEIRSADPARMARRVEQARLAAEDGADRWVVRTTLELDQTRSARTPGADSAPTPALPEPRRP